MKNIIALFGASGSGKNYLIKQLKQSSRYDNTLFKELNFIIPVTSRPPHEGELNGIDYNFITHDRFEDYIKTGELIEFTKFNDWHYGTFKEDIQEGWNIGVFNIRAIQLLKLTDCNIFPILSYCSDKTRLIRQLSQGNEPDIDEILRRFYSDKEDFLTIPFSYDIIINEDIKNEITIYKKDIGIYYDDPNVYNLIVLINSIKQRAEQNVKKITYF